MLHIYGTPGCENSMKSIFECSRSLFSHFRATHRQHKLSIRLPSDVTLAYKRCCVTEIGFVRVCMGTRRFYFKSKKIVYFVTKFDLH